jgi:hypothetical protein
LNPARKENRSAVVSVNAAPFWRPKERSVDSR